MAARTSRLLDTDLPTRTVPAVVACTAALTAAFVGVVALAEGAPGVTGRLPVYVLAGAAVFVAALIGGDGPGTDGVIVLARAAVAGVAGFVLLGLGTEGVIHALAAPESVVATHLFVYLLSAAMVSTGLGYWAVRNWRDVTPVR
ncbi:hypothetical protein [Halosegnis marinus]|uniref:Uncharacterized protein n=1 Tax=Halosegnis marinus TaxID=3034023 RepID=A0ABD5ZMU1_9EURY|nr:hypothetical protein [Halosegnis sp. DT85]